MTSALTVAGPNILFAPYVYSTERVESKSSHAYYFRIYARYRYPQPYPNTMESLLLIPSVPSSQHLLHDGGYSLCARQLLIYRFCVTFAAE